MEDLNSLSDNRFNRTGVFTLGLIGLVLICLWGRVRAQTSKVDRATEQIARSNYLKASNTLESYLDTHPEDAEAWYLLGRCRNRLELYEEAYAALTNAMSYGARTPALHREIGFALQGLKRWPAALQYLRKASEEEPEVWMARAQIQLKQKNYRKAKQALDRVIELDSTLDASAHLLRARIFVLEGKPGLARDQLKKGLRTARLSTMESSYKKLGKLLKLLDQHVFHLYVGIFYREQVNEEKGVVERIRLDAEHRKRIASAVTAYREETAEPDRSPASFRQYVRNSDEHTRTDRLFANLKRLFDRFKKLELSNDELSNLQLMVARSITPPATTTEFLVRAIRTEGNE